MTVTSTMEGKCAQCGYSGDHDIVAMHADGIGFCFGMRCPSCGKLVPEKAWHKYLKTGDVIIPNMQKMSRRVSNGYPKGSRNYI
jgi:uncharacterized Zn finger protein